MTFPEPTACCPFGDCPQCQPEPETITHYTQQIRSTR